MRRDAVPASDVLVEVDPGQKCTCPNWPYCSWLDCRVECPACEDLLDQEREARWADTGQGDAPVDRNLHGNHAGHNAFQQRSA